MKAIVYREFGSPEVLRLEEIDKPAPAPGEVLIRVCAASVNPLDWRLMHGGPLFFRLMMGIRKAKRPGIDVAGEVEAIGNRVSQFKPGESVFGAAKGAFAEYACARESALARKPDNVTFPQAAAVPIAALTALQALRDRAHLQPGQDVLINGAAGGVGTFAVQIAKLLGAEVTAVCSTQKLALVSSLGADHLIDYTQEDFTRSGQRYDVILDCVGNHSFAECRRALKPGGICVGIAPPHGGMMRMGAGLAEGVLLSLFVSQKFVFFMARMNGQDLASMAALLESGQVTPVLDRCFRLSETPQALAYVEQGHARGKVILQML